MSGRSVGRGLLCLFPLVLPRLGSCGLAATTLLSGAAKAAYEDPLGTCFDVPSTICINDEEKGKQFFVEGVRSAPELVAWYSFDKRLPVDETGHGNHLTTPAYELHPVVVGPGVQGKGGSATFDGTSYSVLKNSPDLQTSKFTVAFWVYLLQDSLGSWRTLVSKGTSASELTPSLLLWPNERRVHARVSTRAEWNEGVVETTGLLPLRRWTHLALTCDGSVLRLFVNGMKDGEVILEGPPATNLGDIHLGRDPWRAGAAAYLDDFRWYNEALSEGELGALTFPRITGMQGDRSVSLGCTSCTFAEASKSCGPHKHMCSLQEMFSGGFHVARVMGWLATTPDVWYKNEQVQDEFSAEQRLAVCCKDDADNE